MKSRVRSGKFPKNPVGSGRTSKLLDQLIFYTKHQLKPDTKIPTTRFTIYLFSIIFSNLKQQNRKTIFPKQNKQNRSYLRSIRIMQQLRWKKESFTQAIYRCKTNTIQDNKDVKNQLIYVLLIKGTIVDHSKRVRQFLK